MELDGDLNDVLNEFNEWIDTASKIMVQVKSQDKLVTSLKNQAKFYTDEINYLKNQILRKDQHLDQYREILNHFNSMEGKYLALVKEKEAVDVEISKLKKVREEEKKVWDMEKKSLESAGNMAVEFQKQTVQKRVEDLQLELQREKEDNKCRLNYEQQQHQNEVNYYKQIISQNVETYEEKLLKMNGDLAAAQIEIKNLRQRCVASANIFKVQPHNIILKEEKSERSTPVPVVTIQSIGITSSDATSIMPKQVEVHKQIQIQTTKVKYPSVKKRRLYTPTNDIIELN